LTSLERVELLMALEDRFQTTIDEAAFAEARTVGALRQLVAAPVPDESAAPAPTSFAAEPTPAGPPRVAGVAGGAARAEPVEFPRWSRGPLPRGLRRASYPTWLLPLLRVFVRLRVEGLQHLAALDGPVVFAANHQSHMDAPTVLAALPPRFRHRLAIAMAKEFFKAHFFPEQFSRPEWATSSLNYYLAALFFNGFPLPQREAGTRQTLRYIGELVSDGYSILIFPEGRRTEHGEIATFRSGIGMIGARLGLPVVPVRIVGLDRVLPLAAHWPTPGPVTVRYGAPLRLVGDDYAALTAEVEQAVRAL
jgi:long-chain acyl-CoA synthetase